MIIEQTKRSLHCLSYPSPKHDADKKQAQFLQALRPVGGVWSLKLCCEATVLKEGRKKWGMIESSPLNVCPWRSCCGENVTFDVLQKNGLGEVCTMLHPSMTKQIVILH